MEESAESSSKTESSPEMEREEKLRAVKASILERKRRAARIRKALCKKSKILKIKLWQMASSSADPPDTDELQDERSPAPSPPPKERSPSPSSSPSRSPSPPPLSHRFSPDITCYRRHPLMLTPVKKTSDSSSSKSTKSSDSDNEDERQGNKEEEDDDEEQRDDDGEENEGADNEDSGSAKSADSSDESSGPKISTAQLLLSSRGEPVVKLDASIVEDFIRSGKPIRAAALAALEAVHGKKFTDIDMQRLRKAYIVKPSVPKGRGRRSIYKKGSKPTRAPKPGNWCSVVNSLTYRNSYFQVGDIVHVTGDDEKPYFLQIQSLLMNWREGEAYGSMLWLSPKEGFKGPRFPFHPKNYNLRRDIGSLDCSLDSVTHVLHCPLDYFDGHPSFWRPVPGTVYQRLGEPLVKWVKFEENKPKQAEDAAKETKTEGDKEQAGDQINVPATEDSEQVEESVPASESVSDVQECIMQEETEEMKSDEQELPESLSIKGEPTSIESVTVSSQS